jgi:hypothetical protein
LSSVIRKTDLISWSTNFRRRKINFVYFIWRVFLYLLFRLFLSWRREQFVWKRIEGKTRKSFQININKSFPFFDLINIKMGKYKYYSIQLIQQHINDPSSIPKHSFMVLCFTIFFYISTGNIHCFNQILMRKIVKLNTLFCH